MYSTFGVVKREAAFICWMVCKISRKCILCEKKIVLTSVLTEREGRTEKYWPEVVAARTKRSEIRTKTT